MIRSFLYDYYQININLIKIYLPSIFYLQNAINLAVPLVSHDSNMKFEPEMVVIWDEQVMLGF